MLRLFTAFIYLLLQAPGQAETRPIYDDSGQHFDNKTTYTRIIAASPHAAELVIAAGASASLVGIVPGGNYPHTVSQLPLIGGFSGLDREQVLSLKPDLAIVWSSGNKSTDIHWLENQGIKVFHSEPQKLADISRTIRALGILANTNKVAAVAASAFDQTIADNQCSKTPPYPAYFSIWPQPPMTIGNQHWLNEVLALTGLRNIFADQKRAVFQVDPESLLARDYRFFITAQKTPKKANTLIKNIIIPTTTTRPGPHLADAIKVICLQVDAHL